MKVLETLSEFVATLRPIILSVFKCEMLRKHRYLSLVVFLLGWISVQATAVHHEYSDEHNLSSASHLCIAHAAHLDDVLEASESQLTLTQVDKFRLVSVLVDTLIVPSNFRPQSPRAPPHYS